jgi:hypothetical protein
MPPKEDLLFCKIAIMNGLVSETDAQKVLTLCDRREKEGGRRPPIGAVFSKYNLMRTRDVEKVYDAVRKRSGSSAGLPKTPASKTSTVRGGSRSGRSTLRSVKVDPSRLEKVKGQKAVDSTTLALGIGGLLVFVGILLTIILLMTKGGHKEGGAAKAPPAEADSKAEAPKAVAPPPRPAAAPKPEPAKITDAKDLPDQVRHKMIQALADARTEDDPRKALSLLEAIQQELLRDYGFSPPDLDAEIASLRGAAKAAGGGAPEPEAKAAEPEKSAP